eukprot:scaffold4972_cov48-Attheya_sp.AAC.1
MAPSTPTTTPNVTPIRSRLADEDNRKRKAIATPPRPTPPRTGDSCLRHSGGYIAALSYRVSCKGREVTKLRAPLGSGGWLRFVGFFPVVIVGYKAGKRSFEHVAYLSSTLQQGTRSNRDRDAK